MNAFDWTIVVLCVMCAYYGWRVGAIFSIVFVAAGFIGSWFASNYYSIFSGFFEPHPQAVVYGYLCVFIVVLCVMTAIGFIIHKFIKLLLLGIVNRIFGLIMGCLLGLILSAGIFMPLSTIQNKKIQTMLHDSKITADVIKHTQKIITVFPPKKKKIFQLKIPSKLKKLEKQIKQLPQQIKKIKQLND